MTYNFDPDNWYASERLILERKYKSGEMTQQEFNSALEELEKRLEEMWNRLDGTYQIF